MCKGGQAVTGLHSTASVGVRRKCRVWRLGIKIKIPTVFYQLSLESWVLLLRHVFEQAPAVPAAVCQMPKTNARGCTYQNFPEVSHNCAFRQGAGRVGPHLAPLQDAMQDASLPSASCAFKPARCIFRKHK